MLVSREAPALARGVDVDASIWRMRGASWAQVHLVAGPLRVVPGLRLGADTLARPFVAEPRLATRLRLGSQTEAKLAAGLVHQAPATEHLLAGTGTPDLPIARAVHLGAGLEQTVAERLEFALEAYAKTIDNPLVYPIDGPAEAWDSGQALGVELVSRYRLREALFLRTWIGVARARVVDPSGVQRVADGDQPLILGLVASWDIARGLNLGLRYRLGTGLPYTPLDLSLIHI